MSEAPPSVTPTSSTPAKVNSPAPAAVYQTGRIGNFTYTIGGFKTTTNYLVRLHFCETYWTAPGLRVFNVSINGSPVLTNFDIFAAAGGQNIANIQQFTEPVNSNGQLVIQFTTLVNNSLINGIEIIPGTPKPDFSFSASPPLDTVGVGSSASYTVTLPLRTVSPEPWHGAPPACHRVRPLPSLRLPQSPPVTPY